MEGVPELPCGAKIAAEDRRASVEVRERPILFSAPMVRALLDGRKTQTRRIAKEFADKPDLDAILRRFPQQAGCPYGAPGDRLWVREGLRRSEVGPWVYAADDEPVEMRRGDPRITQMIAWAHHKEGDHAPSIHMPRWASRITLEVTEVRVERLQDIGPEDAIAEGLTQTPGMWWSGFEGSSAPDPISAYALLWQHINGVDSWAANPWVWAVSFKVIIHDQSAEAEGVGDAAQVSQPIREEPLPSREELERALREAVEALDLAMELESMPDVEAVRDKLSALTPESTHDQP